MRSQVKDIKNIKGGLKLPFQAVLWSRISSIAPLSNYLSDHEQRPRISILYL